MTIAVQDNPRTPSGSPPGPLRGAFSRIDFNPRVSHKTLHPGLSSLQPFGLATPEACTYISPGYAFFAYPGKTFTGENRTPEVVRGLASLLRVHFRVLCILSWTVLVTDRRYS